jgi:signal transduction histidine kinase
MVTLSVTDSGRGIDMSKIDDSKSIGIIEVKERVYRMDGEIKFISSENSGTECRIVIPLEK